MKKAPDITVDIGKKPSIKATLKPNQKEILRRQELLKKRKEIQNVVDVQKIVEANHIKLTSVEDIYAEVGRQMEYLENDAKRKKVESVLIDFEKNVDGYREAEKRHEDVNAGIKSHVIHPDDVENIHKARKAAHNMLCGSLKSLGISMRRAGLDNSFLVFNGINLMQGGTDDTVRHEIAALANVNAPEFGQSEVAKMRRQVDLWSNIGSKHV